MDTQMGQGVGKGKKENMEPKKNYFTTLDTTSCFVMKTLLVKSSVYVIQAFL